MPPSYTFVGSDAYGVGSGCVETDETTYNADGTTSESSSVSNWVEGIRAEGAGEGYPLQWTDEPGYLYPDAYTHGWADDGRSSNGPVHDCDSALRTFSWDASLGGLHNVSGTLSGLVSAGNIQTLSSQAVWLVDEDLQNPASLAVLAPERGREMACGRVGPGGGDMLLFLPMMMEGSESEEGVALTGEDFGFARLSSPFAKEVKRKSTARRAYDSGGQLTSITDANGGVTSFTYDAVGNLSSLTDPVGNTTTWTYTVGRVGNPSHTVATETNALGATRYFTYDDNGNLAQYTDRNNRVRQYAYDTSGNVTSETWYADPSLATSHQPLATITYERDSAGRIISESDNFSSVTYIYNASGQITSTTQSSVNGPTVTLEYQYDTAGRRTQMAATIDGVADFVDDYVYDSLGRVVSVTEHGVEGGNAVALKEIDLAYNDAGQLVSIDRYQDGQPVVEGDYSYDEYGRLVGLIYHQGDNVLNSYAWTYSDSGDSVGWVASPTMHNVWQPTGGLMPIHDTAGVTEALMSGGFAGLDLLTSCTSNDGTASYTYDPTGQLTGASYSSSNPQSPIPNPESYSYDLNGNRADAGYVTGLDNQLLSDGTYWYAYDDEGNRIARWIDTNQDGVLDSGDTDITRYTWDTRNRLTQVADFADFASLCENQAEQVVGYLYDVENRWIGRTIDLGGDGVVDHTTTFAYDGNQIVLQFDKDGDGAVSGDDVSHRYLSALDQVFADEQVVNPQAAGNVVWPLADNLGTVRDLAVSQNGITSVANHRVYDSYGNLKSQTNAAVDCIFGFTGLPFDPQTGFYKTPTRPYDPSIGRWAQPDWIIELGGQTNLYAYCGNSPTNATDPSGLDFSMYCPALYHNNDSAPTNPTPVSLPWRTLTDKEKKFLQFMMTCVSNPQNAQLPGAINDTLDKFKLHTLGVTSILGVLNPKYITAVFCISVAEHPACDLGPDAYFQSGLNPGLPLTGHEAMHSLHANQMGSTLLFLIAYGVDWAGQQSYNGEGYEGNLSEMVAKAFEATIKDILNKPGYEHLIDEVAAGTAEQNHPGIREEIKQLFRQKLFEQQQRYDTPKPTRSGSGKWPFPGAYPGTPCFVAGTPVHTEAGLREIETISAGTKVWAYDRERESWFLTPAFDAKAHDYSGSMVTITVGEDTIEATTTHPFWVVSGEPLQARLASRANEDADQPSTRNGQWVPAGDLRSGDVLLGRDGQLRTVISTQQRATSVRVYNLRVDRLNNYAVGTMGLLVNGV